MRAIARTRNRPKRWLVAGLAACAGALLAVATLGSVSAPGDIRMTRAQPDNNPAHTRILMLGDSQMLTLMFYGTAAFSASGPQYESAAIVGCGVFDPGMEGAGSCNERARTWHSEIRTFDPDLSVLLVGAWESLDFVVGGHRYIHGTPAHERELVRVVSRAIRPLTARGGNIALLEVPPFGNPNGDTLYAPERVEPRSVADVNDALRAVAAASP